MAKLPTAMQKKNGGCRSKWAGSMLGAAGSMLGAVSQDSLVFEEPVPPEENKKRKKGNY